MIRILLSGTPTTVVLGLEPENIARMTDAHPVKVNLRNLVPGGPATDLPDVDIIIAATDNAGWATFLERVQG